MKVEKEKRWITEVERMGKRERNERGGKAK